MKYWAMWLVDDYVAFGYRLIVNALWFFPSIGTSFVALQPWELLPQWKRDWQELLVRESLKTGRTNIIKVHNHIEVFKRLSPNTSPSKWVWVLVVLINCPNVGYMTDDPPIIFIPFVCQSSPCPSIHYVISRKSLQALSWDSIYLNLSKGGNQSAPVRPTYIPSIPCTFSLQNNSPSPSVGFVYSQQSDHAPPSSVKIWGVLRRCDVPESREEEGSLIWLANRTPE